MWLPQECVHGTKARISFSGRPHAPVNIVDSIWNVSSWTVSEWQWKSLRIFTKTWCMKYSAVQRSKHAISCIFLHQHSLLPYYCHVYRSTWPAIKAKPCFGASFERSVHGCDTHLLWHIEAITEIYRKSIYYYLILFIEYMRGWKMCPSWKSSASQESISDHPLLSTTVKNEWLFLQEIKKTKHWWLETGHCSIKLRSFYINVGVDSE